MSSPKLDGHGGANAWDDVSGIHFDPVKVQEARREEMNIVAGMNAYSYCDAKEVEETSGNVIDFKWIDVNTGGLSFP